MLAAAFCVLGAQSASAETRTFGFTGSEQVYDVPADVNAIHVVAIGAPGGRGTTSIVAGGGPGGFGARVEADLAVTPGQMLFVEVGGAGANGAVSRVGTGGFNGGGTAFGVVPGGGGGGASDLRTCSIASLACVGVANSLASRLLVAAGGGGGGALGRGTAVIGGNGGSAGADGNDGQAAECEVGRTPGGGAAPGTQSRGGEGGFGGTSPEGDAGAGKPGEFGLGGSSAQGATSPDTGGGGGGGYFGGGAGGNANGCHAGGGGGGSSFAVPSAGRVVVAPDATGESSVVITTIGTVGPPKPSGVFQVGKLTRDRRRGTATLSVRLPGAGTVALTGKGLRKAQRSVAAAGTVKLPIKAVGKLAQRLRRAGTVNVKARIAFAPTGGAPISKTQSVKLVLAG